MMLRAAHAVALDTPLQSVQSLGIPYFMTDTVLASGCFVAVVLGVQAFVLFARILRTPSITALRHYRSTASYTYRSGGRLSTT